MSPLTVGSVVLPRGVLERIGLWRGVEMNDGRVSFTDDVMGFLEDVPGVVVRVAGDKVLVLAREALGWTYGANLDVVLEETRP